MWSVLRWVALRPAAGSATGSAGARPSANQGGAAKRCGDDPVRNQDGAVLYDPQLTHRFAAPGPGRPVQGQ